MCTMKAPKTQQQMTVTPVSAPAPVAEVLSISAAQRKAKAATVGTSALIIPRDTSVGMTGASGLSIGS